MRGFAVYLSPRSPVADRSPPRSNSRSLFSLLVEHINAEYGVAVCRWPGSYDGCVEVEQIHVMVHLSLHSWVQSRIRRWITRAYRPTEMLASSPPQYTNPLRQWTPDKSLSHQCSPRRGQMMMIDDGGSVQEEHIYIQQVFMDKFLILNTDEHC